MPKYSLPPDLQAKLVTELSQKILVSNRPADKLPLLEWVERYRRFDGLPPAIPNVLHDLYTDMHDEVVVLKAAQVGVSEWAINIVLWGADQKWAERGVCLYVFPKQEQMDDFSQDRVNRAIADSFYLKERVMQVEGSEKANRARLRKIGGSPIYFRGSDAIMQTRSIDADIVIMDEVDVFKEGAIERVKQRLGSSMKPLVRSFSQPLYPGGPVDVLWERSDQRHYYLKCIYCGDEQFLDWYENVEFSTDYTDCRVVCRNRTCRRPLDRLALGRWIPHNPSSDIHGYHVNKLYSPRANMKEMLRKSIAFDDPEALQSFYNADLGVPYKPAGTPGLEDYRRDTYPWGDPSVFEGWETYMGIDPGRKLHLTVVGRAQYGDPWRLLFRETLDHFDIPDTSKPPPSVELRWQQFKPRLTVIDGQGEPRATVEWANKHPGRVLRWFHRPGALEPKFQDDEVHYHRTSLLDNLYAVLKAGKCILHTNAGPEFYDQLQAPIREIKKDKDGRLVARYSPSRPDHYAFALSYALVAAGARPSSGMISVVPKVEADIPTVSIARPSWATTPVSRGWSRWKIK